MTVNRIATVMCWLVAFAVAAGASASQPFVLEEAASGTVPAEERSTAATVWFQGFLADDATGDPVSATYNIVARIYSAAGGGSLLWGPETHAAVTITEGWFNIELGSVVSPLPTFASPPYYLSLQVNGEYLVPRLKMASVPSALQSATSDLLPFSATYAGTSDAIAIDVTGANSVDGINVQRTNGTTGAYAIYASNSSPAMVFRGYQGTGTATNLAPVMDLDIANSNNDSKVVDAYTTGAGPAYHGSTDGLRAVQVYAYATDAADDSDAHVVHAVYSGVDRVGDNVGVYGEALDDTWGIGGEFHGSGHGVVGVAEAPSSGALVHRGVVGRAASTTTGQNIGVWGEASAGASNYAGFFSGDVDIAGTLSKDAGSFKIDHPLDPANKYLYHSFVESPDMKNVYDGVVVLDAVGEAWVELPDWFEALNRDFRYQLTALDAPGPNLHVADRISGNRFRIAGGASGASVSWQVTGIRHDPYAEAHRIPVEEVKTGREQGRYRHPELYGAPANAGVLYEVEERGRQAAARRAERPERATDESETE